MSLGSYPDYNAAGQVEIIDPPGYGTTDRTVFTYDPSRGDLLPLTRQDPLLAQPTQFGYDAFNRRTRVTDPNGMHTETEYDSMGRVSRIIQRSDSTTLPNPPVAADLVTNYEYDRYGDLFRVTLPQGNVIEYGYDHAGRLVSIERKPNASTPGDGQRTQCAAAPARQILPRLRIMSGRWLSAQIIALLCCAIAEAVEPDYAGLRFRCGSLQSNICLSVLEPGCSLRIVKARQEDGPFVDLLLPPESGEVLALECNGTTETVTSADDLVGHVTIRTPAEALEYLRFYSSLWTVSFFDEQEMEIFLAEDDECYASCLPQARWSALALRATTVEPLERGFRVRRNVVRPVPSPMEVTGYRVVVDVLPDGALREGREEKIPLAPEDRGRLVFRLAM